MANLLYWTLRIVLWLMIVATVYLAIMAADGRLWLQLPLVLAVVVIYILLDQSFRDMRGRTRRR